MMSRISRNRTNFGFTLAEVVIALAVTAGGLLLLLSANRASLVRSLRSSVKTKVEQAAQSKLNEIVIGAERSEQGDLEDVAGYSWSVEQEPLSLEGVQKLRRVTLFVKSSRGQVATKTVLHYGPLPGTAK